MTPAVAAAGTETESAFQQLGQRQRQTEAGKIRGQRQRA